MGSLSVFRICTCISIFNIIKHLFHVRFWPHCDKIVSIRFRVGKRRTFSKLNNDNANILHTFAKYYEYKLVHRLQTLNTTQQDTQLKALNSFGQHVARLKWKLYVALIKKVKNPSYVHKRSWALFLRGLQMQILNWLSSYGHFLHEFNQSQRTSALSPMQ